MSHHDLGGLRVRTAEALRSSSAGRQPPYQEPTGSGVPKHILLVPISSGKAWPVPPLLSLLERHRCPRWPVGPWLEVISPLRELYSNLNVNTYLADCVKYPSF